MHTAYYNQKIWKMNLRLGCHPFPCFPYRLEHSYSYSYTYYYSYSYSHSFSYLMVLAPTLWSLQALYLRLGCLPFPCFSYRIEHTRYLLRCLLLLLLLLLLFLLPTPPLTWWPLQALYLRLGCLPFPCLTYRLEHSRYHLLLLLLLFLLLLLLLLLHVGLCKPCTWDLGVFPFRVFHIALSTPATTSSTYSYSSYSYSYSYSYSTPTPTPSPTLWSW
jgi:hypothetical protein